MKRLGLATVLHALQPHKEAFSEGSNILNVCKKYSGSKDSKAFDHVPHLRLTSKLSSLNTDPNILLWMKDFLSLR